MFKCAVPKLVWMVCSVRMMCLVWMYYCRCAVLNAILKRWVLRSFLKISGDVAFRIVGGRIFHSMDAAIERSPRVLDDLIAEE